MYTTVGPVCGPEYHNHIALLHRALASALNRQGRGQGFYAPRRFGRTSLLLQLQYLVQPCNIGTEAWISCWEELLRHHPLPIGLGTLRSTDEVAEELLHHRAVLPVLVPLGSARDAPGLTRAIQSGIRRALFATPEGSLARARFACLMPELEGPPESPTGLLERVKDVLMAEYGHSAEAPILWLLLDDVTFLLSDALAGGDFHWCAPLLGLLRDAIDMQASTSGRSCLNTTLAVSPRLLSLAADPRLDGRPNFASSLITRHDWRPLPLWPQEEVKRFLQRNHPALLPFQKKIWETLGGLPLAIKWLMLECPEEGEPFNLDELLDEVMERVELRQVLAEWRVDLGEQLYQDLFTTERPDPAACAQLKGLGMLVENGSGGFQARPRLYGLRPRPRGPARLAFILPGKGLTKEQRGVARIGPGQVAAVALLVGEGANVGDMADCRGVSPRDLLALYTMSVAGVLCAPGLLLEDMKSLAVCLCAELPCLDALMTPDNHPRSFGGIKGISEALRKIGALSEFFVTSGRGRAAPYGTAVDAVVELHPYVLVKDGEHLTLSPLKMELMSALQAALAGVTGQIEAPDFSMADIGNLLVRLFESRELRNFLMADPEGEMILADLPQGSVALTDFAHQVVSALDRRGAINEAFFRRLVRERPRREEEISRVQLRWSKRRK